MGKVNNWGLYDNLLFVKIGELGDKMDGRRTNRKVDSFSLFPHLKSFTIDMQYYYIYQKRNTMVVPQNKILKLDTELHNLK